MRPRKPWYRSDRDGWFVQHNGKQVLLAKGKANKAEAQAAFHKLMLLSGETPLRAEVIAVAMICDLFSGFFPGPPQRIGVRELQAFPAGLLRQLRKAGS